jgi:peptidoglycan/LPS O-acetylase OafA/YrhL
MRLSGQYFLPHWMLANDILNKVTPFRIDALLLGGFLALAIRGGSRNFLLHFARRAFPVCAVLALLLAIRIPNGRVWRIPYPYPEWISTWGLTVLDILSALMILVALQPGSLLYKALSNRQLRWIGKISYGAYVLHDIPHILYMKLASKLVQLSQVIWRSNDFAQQTETVVLAAVIALASTLVLAALSFKFFESPFLRLKEKWTTQVTP